MERENECGLRFNVLYGFNVRYKKVPVKRVYPLEKVTWPLCDFVMNRVMRAHTF